MLLVGDIGGTKTDLAIVPLRGSTDPEAEATFRSAEFPRLEDLVATFLERIDDTAYCSKAILFPIRLPKQVDDFIGFSVVDDGNLHWILRVR